eukprot:NODE_3_length_80033_cov_0.932970.p8 type:complete len:574 gc:universal NODE_3_length_80033_cov_0.932970:20534-18813(-)
MEIFIDLHMNTKYEFLLQYNDVVKDAKKLFLSAVSYHFIKESYKSHPLNTIFVQVIDFDLVLNYLTKEDFLLIFNKKGLKKDIKKTILNPSQSRIGGQDLFKTDAIDKIQKYKGFLYRLDTNYVSLIKMKLISRYCIRNPLDLTSIFRFNTLPQFFSDFCIDDKIYCQSILDLDSIMKILDPTHPKFKDIGESKLPIVNHLLQHIESRLFECQPHSSIHLNRYTVGDVYVKILQLCMPYVDNECLYGIYNLLLSQYHFRCESRGKWYIGSIAAFEKYHEDKRNGLSKNSVNKRILNICKIGINDNYIHPIETYTLEKKCLSIQKKLNIRRSEHILLSCHFKEAPNIFWKSYVLRKPDNSRPLYYSSNVEEALPVEQFVLREYRKKGYSGIHCESRLFLAIFKFFMYDVLHDPSFKNTVIHGFQENPMDLLSIFFYVNRKKQVENILSHFKDWGVIRLRRYIQDHRNRFNEQPFGVRLPSDINYTMSVENFSFICEKLGSRSILSICNQLSKNFRRNLSGGPDLVIWSATDCKLIEVKGENDVLQTNQKIWIDTLLGSNAPIYVLKVNSSNSKA